MRISPYWMVASTLALAACDNGSSAVQTRDRSGEAVAFTSTAATAASAEAEAEAPIWTSNRRETAEQNLKQAFDRNGAAFEAADPRDFAAKTKAFIETPPGGTETIRRTNGDTLYYHAASNTFAVANADGVPRTMFKPDEGAAYWAEQKTREAARTARAEESRSG